VDINLFEGIDDPIASSIVVLGSIPSILYQI